MLQPQQSQSRHMLQPQQSQIGCLLQPEQSQVSQHESWTLTPDSTLRQPVDGGEAAAVSATAMSGRGRGGDGPGHVPVPTSLWSSLSASTSRPLGLGSSALTRPVSESPRSSSTASQNAPGLWISNPLSRAVAAATAVEGSPTGVGCEAGGLREHWGRLRAIPPTSLDAALFGGARGSGGWGRGAGEGREGEHMRRLSLSPRSQPALCAEGQGQEGQGTGGLAEGQGQEGQGQGGGQGAGGQGSHLHVVDIGFSEPDGASSGGQPTAVAGPAPPGREGQQGCQGRSDAGCSSSRSSSCDKLQEVRQASVAADLQHRLDTFRARYSQASQSLSQSRSARRSM